MRRVLRTMVAPTFRSLIRRVSHAQPRAEKGYGHVGGPEQGPAAVRNDGLSTENSLGFAAYCPWNTDESWKTSCCHGECSVVFLSNHFKFIKKKPPAIL